ncbi:Outer membrane protein assembly factor BamA, partial [termite gut metagenome]
MFLFCCVPPRFAQDGGIVQDTVDYESKPIVLYSGIPKKYEIAEIKVAGTKDYEDYVLIGLSGLSVGQTISVPGEEITQAIKRYWRHGLFSDVHITAERIENNKIYLKILLTQRPRISDVRYHGIKKSEREDLETKLGMVKGSQVTPNLIDRAQTLIQRYFDDKGFKNAEVAIAQKDDPANENQVIVDIDIDKKEKVKVHRIIIAGNDAIKV